MYSIIHWDTETHQILPGRPAPPPVCLQWLGVRPDGSVDGPHILTGPAMIDWFAWALRGTDAVLSGLNQSYDLLVMIEAAVRAGMPALDVWRAVFGMLCAGRKRCTEVQQRLLRIAQGLPDAGGLSMAEQWRIYFDEEIEGKDDLGSGWRLRFAELERWPRLVRVADYPHVRPVWVCMPEQIDPGLAWAWSEGDMFVACAPDVVTPVQAAALLRGEIEPGSLRDASTWPRDAFEYAYKDPLRERALYLQHLEIARDVFGQEEIPDAVARPVHKFMLHLMSSRGLRTDKLRADIASASLQDSLALLREMLVEHGLMRKTVKPKRPKPGQVQTVKYTKDQKAIHARIEATLLGAGKHAERKPATPKMQEKACKLREEGKHDKAEALERGNLRADKEVMQLAELAADEGLRAKVAYDGAEKMLSTYVAPLAVDCGGASFGWCGLERPMSWRYDAVKNTGRTSAKKSRFTFRRDDGEIVKLADGNNVQNYPTFDALLVKARDIMSIVGYGSPGDGRFADDRDDDGEPFHDEVSETIRGISAPQLERERRAALARKLQGEDLSPTQRAVLDFCERREVLWARRHDVRAMVQAREGYVLVNRDYSGIEMCTLAQCQNLHFGREVTLAKVLNDGLDAHLYVGVLAHMTLWGESLTYEQLVTIRHLADAKKKAGKVLTDQERRVLETRKLCKVINFGFLGGMGAATFVQYVWQRIRMTLRLVKAQQLKSDWYEAFEEMPEWFAYIGQQVELGLPVVQVGSGRVRAGCTFTQNANTRFQGLAADGGLNANFKIWFEALCNPASALFGAYPLVFEHDAFLVEVLEFVNGRYAANDADYELDRLMVAGMAELVPDIRIRTEGLGNWVESANGELYWVHAKACKRCKPSGVPTCEHAHGKRWAK